MLPVLIAAAFSFFACVVLINDARELQRREHAEALRNLVLHEWFLMLDRRRADEGPDQ